MICSPTFKVIQFYKGQGLVSVFQWNLPLKSQKEIRTEAMFTAMNDCTLRSVGRYDLLTIVDIDEFILPTRPNSTQARARPEQEPDTNYPTLVDLMANSVIKHPKVGSFVFCNVFHYLYWENATNLLEKYWPVNTQEKYLPQLVTQTKLKRTKTPNKNGQRSKYIIRPEYALMVGNHVVWTLVKGAKQRHMAHSEGLSHHYRICEFGGFECLKKPAVIDTTAQKWGPNLILNVAENCQQIFGPESCPPAPPLGSPW